METCSDLQLFQQDDKQSLEFGPWLSTQPMNTSLFDSKKYVGNTDHEKQRGQGPKGKEGCGSERTYQQKERKEETTTEVEEGLEREAEHTECTREARCISITKKSDCGVTTDQDLFNPICNQNVITKRQNLGGDIDMINNEDNQPIHETVMNGPKVPNYLMGLDSNNARGVSLSFTVVIPIIGGPRATSQREKGQHTEVMTNPSKGQDLLPKQSPHPTWMAPKPSINEQCESNKSGRWKRKTRGKVSTRSTFNDITNLQE